MYDPYYIEFALATDGGAQQYQQQEYFDVRRVRRRSPANLVDFGDKSGMLQS